VLLTMAESTSGTVLASSTYMWYGNVKATFRTSRGQGVVTAFILLSDIKDEIDYEFVGADLAVAQTNFYWQGAPNYKNSANITLSNTFETYHEYEIDWTPESITWKVDGQIGRVKNRLDTWNATANRWDYPQTPARVQLSIWPAGLSSNGQGTIDWAGGLVNWDAEDVKEHGYYYTAFKSVEISCYNAKSAPGTNKGKSYTYNKAEGTNDTVVDGNGDTVLSSFIGTGTDMKAGAAASGSAQPGSTAQTIPGLSGAGPGSNAHGDSGSDSNPGSGGSDSGSGSTDTGTNDDGANPKSFIQDNTASNTQNNAAPASQEKVLKGSVFAGIVAVVAMMAL